VKCYGFCYDTSQLDKYINSNRIILGIRGAGVSEESLGRRIVDVNYLQLKSELDLLRQSVDSRIAGLSEKHGDLRGDVDGLTKAVQGLTDTVSSAVKYILGGVAVISFLMSGYGIKILTVLGGGS
jgi:hypothetical protein